MARFHHDLLRTLRLDLGMSQEEAARALGIDVRTYRRYESGAVNDGGPFEIRNASRRRLLRRMCDELGVADEEAWLAPDGGPEPPPPSGARDGRALRRGHALQRAPHFVGREEAQAELAGWLARDDTPVLVVVGIGGAGKTALVERFVESLAGLEVYVHSFYDDPHTERVVEELEDAARSSAPLLVLDGLETVQSEGGNGHAFGELLDPALRRELRAAAARLARRKVLVTSRFPLTDLAAWEGSGVRTLKLPPLSPGESRTLLRAWGLSGDDRSLAPLCEQAAGHALSVAMLGSYVGTFLGGDPAHATPLALEGAPNDDPLARRLSSVLDAYAAALAPQERELLARLSLFAGAADVPLLAAIAEASHAEVLRTLARLERLGLVARTEAGATAHPFVREHFKAQLAVPREDAHARLRDALHASLAGKPSIHVRDASLLDRCETLLEQTRRSGRARDAWGIYRRALGGFSNLGLRLGAMTRGARVVASFSANGAPERVTDGIDGEALAELQYDWGLYAGALGDLPLARRCHDAHARALERITPDVALPRRAMGLRTQAYVAWLAGESERARTLLDASLALARELESAFHLARGFALYAMVEHDAGDPAAADVWLAEARRVEATPTARRAFWEAEILLVRGEREAARALASGAVTDCGRRGWAGHVAHGTTLLGLAWVDDDPTRAAECLAQAWPWVRQAHEVEMALRCRHLAVQVARARKRETDAERERDLGRALAETHGFARFVRLFGQSPHAP